MKNPNTNSQSELDRLMTPREVAQTTGMSRTSLWRMVRARAFPAPVQVGARRIAWRQSEIANWMSSLGPTNGTGPIVKHNVTRRPVAGKTAGR